MGEGHIQELADGRRNKKLFVKHGTAKLTVGISSVEIDVSIKNSEVKKFASRVVGNLPCKASTRILDRFVVGKSYSSLCMARNLLWHLLNLGTPVNPNTPFETLNLLSVFHEKPELHNEVLLPFDALIQAMQTSGKLQKGNYGQVHVWLGTFTSEDAYKAFMNERYDEENDHEPVNQFAASQAELGYDPAWLESQFLKDAKWQQHVFYAGGMVRTDDYEEIVTRADQLDQENFNTYFTYIEPNCVQGSLEFSNPRSFKNAECELFFLGSFEPTASAQFR